MTSDQFHRISKLMLELWPRLDIDGEEIVRVWYEAMRPFEFEETARCLRDWKIRTTTFPTPAGVRKALLEKSPRRAEAPSLWVIPLEEVDRLHQQQAEQVAAFRDLRAAMSEAEIDGHMRRVGALTPQYRFIAANWRTRTVPLYMTFIVARLDQGWGPEDDIGFRYGFWEATDDDGIMRTRFRRTIEAISPEQLAEGFTVTGKPGPLADVIPRDYGHHQPQRRPA